MNPTDRTNRTGMQKDRQKQGFTIMEMLIVVAIIAILVAVSIPIFHNSLHKAKVAADKANVRAYYAELQLEYLTTGEYREGITDEMGETVSDKITFADGTTVKLQAGRYGILLATVQGEKCYQIHYFCDATNHQCTLTLC